MRAQHALATKSDLLGAALRRDVLGIRDELQPFELELGERPPGQDAKGTRAHTTS